MANQFLAGKNSRMQVGAQATNLTANHYTCAYNGKDLDTLNFESNGFDEGIIGPIDLTWTVKAVWNANQQPLSDPPGLFPRSNGTNMIILPQNSSPLGYTMPSWRCFGSTISSAADGTVDFDANGKNNGTFTTPNGNP